MGGNTKAPLTKADAPKSGGKRAAWRAAARAKRKNYYAGGEVRTAANKRKKLRRHLRKFPEDGQARIAFEQKLNFGDTSNFGMRSRAEERLMRRERAARRAAR